MKNKQIYKDLKQKAFDENWTLEQLDALTHQQAVELLGQNMTLSFLRGMKKGIRDAFQARDDEANRQEVEQHLHGLLTSKYPNAVVEKSRQYGKPHVIVWLEGKPNE